MALQSEIQGFSGVGPARTIPRPDMNRAAPPPRRDVARTVAWSTGLLAGALGIVAARHPIGLGEPTGLRAWLPASKSRRTQRQLATAAALTLSSTSLVALLRRSAAASPPPAVERTLTIGAGVDTLVRTIKQQETWRLLFGASAELAFPTHDASSFSVKLPIGTVAVEARAAEGVGSDELRWDLRVRGKHRGEAVARFRHATRGDGTEVTFRIRADRDVPLARGLSLLGPAAKLALSTALHRFKSLVETGEVPTLHTQPAARQGGRDT